jgi:hypothetical protein
LPVHGFGARFGGEKATDAQRHRGRVVEWAMKQFLHLDETRYPVKVRWFLIAGWAVILAKCTAVWWAVDHWRVPFSSAWVIVPTLIFAALATSLWIGVRDD